MKERLVLDWIMPLVEENYTDNPIVYKKQIYSLKTKKISIPKTYKHKIKILFLSHTFFNGINKLRKDFNIPPNGFKYYKDCLIWGLKIEIDIYKKYNRLLLEVLKDNLCSERWYKFIEAYLLFNKQIDDLTPRPINILYYDQENEVIQDLVKIFDLETNEARNMSKYSELLKETIFNIIGKKQDDSVSSIFSLGKTSIASDSKLSGLDDFELVSFLIVK